MRELEGILSYHLLRNDRHLPREFLEDVKLYSPCSKVVLLQGELRICFMYQHKPNHFHITKMDQNNGLRLSFLPPNLSQKIIQPKFQIFLTIRPKPPISPQVFCPAVMATASRTRAAVRCSGTSKDFSRKFSTSKLGGRVPLPDTWRPHGGLRIPRGIDHTGGMDIS